MRASMGRPFDIERHAAVLGPAVLGDVEPGQDLDPVDDAGRHRGREVDGVVHDPVDAQAEAQPAVVGLDVHVRGTLGDGPVEKVLDESRHLDVVLRGVVDTRRRSALARLERCAASTAPIPGRRPGRGRLAAGSGW